MPGPLEKLMGGDLRDLRAEFGKRLEEATTEIKALRGEVRDLRAAIDANTAALEKRV